MCRQMIIIESGGRIGPLSVLYANRTWNRTEIRTRPSTRIRFCVRIAVRFRARFAGKPDRYPIIHLTTITMLYKHISENTNSKNDLLPLLAANRTPNRTPILCCKSQGRFHVPALWKLPRTRNRKTIAISYANRTLNRSCNQPLRPNYFINRTSLILMKRAT
jgi:hypothetical protein